VKVDVIDFDAKKVGKIDLADEVFGVDVRPDLMHRTVRWQLAKRRAGTHKTKSVAEIRGSTRKPFKQKGTGRARAGSRRAAHHRGGVAIFGPQLRDHAHKLPKKVRKLALKSALSSKRADGKLAIVDSLDLGSARTRVLAERLAGLGWSSALVIDGDEIDAGFARAARNLTGIQVLPQLGANVYDILRRDRLVLTRKAVESLQARLA
jgi:large subunit ribosomal protein L4